MNVHPEDAFDLMESVTSLVDGGKPATIEIRYLHQDGHYIWMEVSPTPVIENGQVKRLFTIARDITERKRLQDKIAKMAFYDHLSGIPNRRTFDDKLQKAIDQAKRSGKKWPSSCSTGANSNKSMTALATMQEMLSSRKWRNGSKLVSARLIQRRA
nr:PAS domain S-box protein [Planococcus glaciei]